MTGQGLAEAQGGRAGQGRGLCGRGGLRALGFRLRPCDVGWQVPRELWPNPPGGSDRLSRL